MTTREPYGDHYKDENAGRSGNADWEPCALCGRDCNPLTGWWVAVNHETNEYATAEEVENSMGVTVSVYRVGSTCKRYVPKTAHLEKMTLTRA